jgi:hypothetical protein
VFLDQTARAGLQPCLKRPGFTGSDYAIATRKNTVSVAQATVCATIQYAASNRGIVNFRIRTYQDTVDQLLFVL